MTKMILVSLLRRIPLPGPTPSTPDCTVAVPGSYPDPYPGHVKLGQFLSGLPSVQYSGLVSVGVAKVYKKNTVQENTPKIWVGDCFIKKPVQYTVEALQTGSVKLNTHLHNLTIIVTHLNLILGRFTVQNHLGNSPSLPWKLQPSI